MKIVDYLEIEVSNMASRSRHMKIVDYLKIEVSIYDFEVSTHRDRGQTF